MADQLHKRFNDEQVKELLTKYHNGEIQTSLMKSETESITVEKSPNQYFRLGTFISNTAHIPTSLLLLECIHQLNYLLNSIQRIQIRYIKRKHSEDISPLCQIWLSMKFFGVSFFGVLFLLIYGLTHAIF